MKLRDKLALIRRRAKRMWLLRPDQDDAQQEIIGVLESFVFDPARSNGATLETVLTTIIDNQLRMIRRRARRYRRRVEPLEEAIEEHGEPLAPRRDVDLEIDVQSILARLSVEDRKLCLAVASGHTVSEIASQLGCSRYTVRRRLDRLRCAFSGLGIDGKKGKSTP